MTHSEPSLKGRQYTLRPRPGRRSNQIEWLMRNKLIVLARYRKVVFLTLCQTNVNKYDLDLSFFQSEAKSSIPIRDWFPIHPISDSLIMYPTNIAKQVPLLSLDDFLYSYIANVCLTSANWLRPKSKLLGKIGDGCVNPAIMSTYW